MTSLVLLGDTAWPTPRCLDLSEVRAALGNAAVILNLEGPLLAQDAALSRVHDEYKFNLYSCSEFLTVARALNVIAFSVANNHAADYAGGLTHTCEAAQRAGIACFGTGGSPVFRCRIAHIEHIVVGLCSPATELRPAATGVSPCVLSPSRALALVEALRARNRAAAITVFVHWGYELMAYPQPADRELARRLIDHGADYVIGHHAHVVQPVERHRNGLIAYSLGNFALPQAKFRGRTLHYRGGAVEAQLGVRLHAAGASLIRMRYEREHASIRVMEELPASAADEAGLVAPFAGFDEDRYRAWFSEFWRCAPAKPRSVPVFNSYFGYRRIESHVKQKLLETRWAARRAAIRLGLHTPYNW